MAGQEIQRHHVNFQFAKAARKADVLPGREMLAAKHQHAVVVESMFEQAERGVVEVLREVDAFDQVAEPGALRRMRRQNLIRKSNLNQ